MEEIALGQRCRPQAMAVFSPIDAGTGGEAAEKPRILIVEDDFLVAGELEYQLVRAGFEVVGIASTADEAFALASTEKPILTIMDVRLAGEQDGVQAAIRIFQDLGIRSIFATAHADPLTVSRAISANPIGWLQKPYAPEMLITALKTALSL